MIQEYLEHLSREGRYSKATLGIISRWLTRFEQFSGDRDPAALTSADLLAWRHELTWQPGSSGRMLSENTINQAVLAVRGFYRWAMAEALISMDPAASLKIRAVRLKRRPKLAVAERRKLLAFPNLDVPVGIRDRAVIALLLETGISRPACSRLDLAHLQLDTGALRANGRKSGGIHTLSDGLCADLERYLKEARPLLIRSEQIALFLNTRGGRLSGPSVQRIIRHALLVCGLPSNFSSS